MMLCMFSVFSACNNEWVEELYPHMVSLKAPVGGEGVADVGRKDILVRE